MITPTGSAYSDLSQCDEKTHPLATMEATYLVIASATA
jgi:hypothetical protein